MSTNTAARRWVDTAAPKLGNTVTELTQTSAEEVWPSAVPTSV
jgi:hypothetical protein